MDSCLIVIALLAVDEPLGNAVDAGVIGSIAPSLFGLHSSLIFKFVNVLDSKDSGFILLVVITVEAASRLASCWNKLRVQHSRLKNRLEQNLMTSQVGDITG